tara:strand:- start:13259 stop:13429 length:171 start_codon:yes stop_codon:yes gene_type:complete
MISMPWCVWKASSVVRAGENVLDSILRPAIAILGNTSDDVGLQLKRDNIRKLKKRL